MFYVYRITDCGNKKMYIGCRKSKNNDLHFDLSRYRSSSTDKEFKRRMTEYPERFKFEILKTFNNVEDAMREEKKMLVEADVLNNDMYYNKRAVSSCVYYTPRKTNNSSRKNMESIPVCEATRERMSFSAKKRGMNNDIFLTMDREGECNPFYGKKHSDATKKKLSELAKNRSPEHILKLKKAAQNRPPRTRESIEKQKITNSKRKSLVCPHCGFEGSLPGIGRWHLSNCKKRLV